LIWMKADSGKGMNFSQALRYAENLELGDKSDWRLPNAKELQSIVDYTRCPDVTGTAAIDPIFDVTAIKNEGGKKDYPFYWTGTSHVGGRGSAGVYIAFGRGLGFMQDPRTGRKNLMDVHGAGAQRSDPKAGNASQFPTGRGPQGDVIRINNFVRCVRGGTAEPRTTGPKVETIQRERFQQGDRQGQMQRGGGDGMRTSGGDFVRRLDHNGDGKVSMQEFDGPAEHFGLFDRNRDGFLAEDEAPQGPPPNRQIRNRQL